MATVATTDEAALALEVDEEAIAWLTFDRPESRANLLTTGVMRRLDALLTEIEEGARAGSIRGVVVRSGKPGMFIAGADVGEIAGITDPADGESKSRQGQAVFLRLDRLPVFTVAAIDGVCLGGGTEMALACDYRLAADDPATRIGLPEVQLGIIPGFGGTVRLPRLVGLQAALPMILTGKPVDARKAYRIGLADERVPAPILGERARQVVRERAAGKPLPQRRRKLADRLLDNPVGRKVVLSQARKRVLAETGGHYPAPLAALDALAEIESLPLDQALRVEARTLGRLVVTPVCKNLIGVFRLMEAAKKPVTDAAPRPVARVGVVGAGVMGGGIAQLLAYRGLEVRLKDIVPAALGHGLRTARELFDRAVKRGRLGRREASRLMQAIAPTLDYSGFGTTGLVIEAVVERMDVKEQVLREIEAAAEPGCIVASNTSALSISEMQQVLSRPEDFCGMHFFNPVSRMPLVEVVRGARTSDEAIATVWAVSRRLDKTPLVVQDGPGFLVNRILAPYMNEAGYLLADGASVKAIDDALVAFGMPMGPLRLLDEVGWDVGRHVAEILYHAFGERMRPAPPLEATGRSKRLGRKGGLGFYHYEGGKEKGVDASVYRELGDAVPDERRGISDEGIRERCLLAMVNEAARALEDGIVARAGHVDLALITGTGFPPFRGGLLRWADTIGIEAVLQKLEAFERTRGTRFSPAPLIREKAARGEGFYAGATA